jgi:hypothetical protein
MIFRREIVVATELNGKEKVAAQGSFPGKYAFLELNLKIFPGMLWHFATC